MLRVHRRHVVGRAHDLVGRERFLNHAIRDRFQKTSHHRRLDRPGNEDEPVGQLRSRRDRTLENIEPLGATEHQIAEHHIEALGRH